MKEGIYLDNNATTFLDPSVADVMAEYLQHHMANPSSIHSFGQKAKAVLLGARRDIAAFFVVKPHEIVFTSGGTESLNMVIRGIAKLKKGHIISSDVEHPAVYETVKCLEKEGCTASFLSTGEWGAVTPERVKDAIQHDTCLIALMAANNETGVKTDIEAIAEIAKESNIPFVVDGVASLGKEPLHIPDGVSAMCFSAHKFHGPKGVGFAYIDAKLKLEIILSGGGQEFQRRSGTENLLGIVGLRKAISLVGEKLPQASQHMAELRELLERGIIDSVSDVTINGKGPRIVNTTNIAFHGVEGETLFMNLDQKGVAVGYGSACSSGSLSPSRILINMGCPRAVAGSSLRFSLCRMTTREEIEKTIDLVAEVVSRMRGLV